MCGELHQATHGAIVHVGCATMGVDDGILAYRLGHSSRSGGCRAPMREAKGYRDATLLAALFDEMA